MSRYPHWNKADFQESETFRASIYKIDEHMSRDQCRWTLTEEARRAPFADFKPGKLSHWKNVIRVGGMIPPIELSVFGGGDFDILDGRHRTYALHEEGFTEIMVQILPFDERDNRRIQELRELLAP